MLPAPASTMLARLWRSHGRLLAAVIALVTAVTYWHGWVGWAIGIFAGTGLVLFEFRKWWDYVARGEPESAESQTPISGSARFREPGTTSVRLLSVGDQPSLVAMRLRVITGLGDSEVAALMDCVPRTLTNDISFSSAQHTVNALRAAGARAQVLVAPTVPSDDERSTNAL